MTKNNDPFIDIRPYNDDEIPAAIDRLVNDEEFISAILQHRFSNHAGWFKALMSPIVKIYLKMKWSKLNSVDTIQQEVKKYLDQTLNTTTTRIHTGIEWCLSRVAWRQTRSIIVLLQL